MVAGSTADEVLAASVVFDGLPWPSFGSWIWTSLAPFFFKLTSLGFVSQQMAVRGVLKGRSSSSTSGRLGAGIAGVPDPETSAFLSFEALGTSTMKGSGSSSIILLFLTSKAGWKLSNLMVLLMTDAAWRVSRSIF